MKAYQSRIQQQERLANRYLKIVSSTQSPYYKGIKIIFQSYKKTSKVCLFRLKKRED